MLLLRYVLVAVFGVCLADGSLFRPREEPRDEPREESQAIPGVPTVVMKTILGRYHGDLRPVFRGDPETRVKDKYIVMLRSGSTRSTLDRVIDQFRRKVDLASRVAKKLGLQLDFGDINDVMDQLLMVIVARLPVVALTIMRTLRDVDFIEEVQTVVMCSEEWHLDRLDQPALPLDLRKFRRNGEGSSVDVYVLDSGIRYSHQEFEGRASWSGYDAFDSDGTNRGADANGHGTHVAALVGGRRFGVAGGVRLRSVRVLDDLGNGDSSTILLGINHVAKQVQNNTAGRRSVVVMSLRGSRSGVNASTLNQMARELVATGTPVVAAAGNDRRDACKYVPGSEEEVITVGGTNPADGTYRQTNYGRCVDILAPAVRVRSAGARCDDCFRVSSGTSQAAPLVAGVVVAMLDEDPSLTPAQIRMKLLQDAVSDRIDLSDVPGDMRLQTPNKLLHIPERSAFQPRVTPACRTVWSIKSGGGDGDPASAACNVNETIMGCSSLAADGGMRAGEFNTELPNGRQACVALNGAGGTGVYATARCCSWPGARCYLKKSGKSSSRDDAEVKAKCDRTVFSCDTLVGCSASSETGFIDGVRPERSRLFGLIPSALRKCSAQNGEGGSGVTAHATCCKSRDMKCQAVWSEEAKTGETQVAVTCPSGTLLTGCNVYEKDGRAEGAYPVDNTCMARGRGVKAVAICCKRKNSIF